MTGSKASILRVTATRKGKVRCIVTIRTQKGGDLIVVVRSASLSALNSREAPKTADDLRSQPSTVTYRTSVHPSLKSKNDVSTIKNTTEYSDGTKTTKVLYTTAIKKSNGFCPVMLCACGNLLLDQFDNTKSGKSHNIGSVEDVFTVTFGLFVSSPKVTYILPPGDHYNVLTMNLGLFNVTMLYSFLAMPATTSTHLRDVSSVSGEAPFAGVQDIEIEAFFNNTLDGLRATAAKFLAFEKPNFHALEWGRLARFFNSGSFDNPAFQAWRKEVVAHGLMDPVTIRAVSRPGR